MVIPDLRNSEKVDLADGNTVPNQTQNSPNSSFQIHLVEDEVFSRKNTKPSPLPGNKD